MANGFRLPTDKENGYNILITFVMLFILFGMVFCDHPMPLDDKKDVTIQCRGDDAYLYTMYIQHNVDDKYFESHLHQYLCDYLVDVKKSP